MRSMQHPMSGRHKRWRLGLAAGAALALGVPLALVATVPAAAVRDAQAQASRGVDRAVPAPRTAGPAGRRAPSSSLLWSADMEEGNLRDWYQPATCECASRRAGGGEFDSGEADASASRDVAHSGQWAAKLVQNNGGTRLFRWRESRRRTAAYYSVWFFFPRQYSVTAGWWNVFQWKSRSRSSGANDPFWHLDVLNRPDGSMYLRLGNRKSNVGYDQVRVNVPIGRWFRVRAFLRQSTTGQGRIVVWQDAEKLWDVRGITTKFADGDQGWSVNSYSVDVEPRPAVIYADDARIEKGPEPR
jgi:polysaccharide lyase-like protein